MIEWKDFEKVDMRIGTVTDVKDFPEARRPAFQLWIDFGSEIGVLKSSAQITEFYSKSELLNRQVIAVVNFPKKQIANFMSECLVLGAVGDPRGVILLSPDSSVENGLRIS